MAGSEIGTGYSGGDYENSNFYNGDESEFNIARTDSPDTNKSKVKADDFNDLAAEVVATQKVLGADAKGNKSTVSARLSAGSNNDGHIFSIRRAASFGTVQSAIDDLPM